MIETRLMNYFLAVAREQNITKAAEVLNITQPTLSKQLQELENQLGKKLFIRTSKNTVLTEDGVYFRAKAQEIIDLVEKAEKNMKEDSDTLSGDVYIGAAESHYMNDIAKIMCDIHSEYPDIHFHIVSGMADDIFDQLDKGLLDFGLMLSPVSYEKFNYELLPYPHHIGLLMRNDHPLTSRNVVTIDDISKIPLIFPNQTYGDNAIASWFRNYDNLNIVATYNLIYNAIFLVENGMGSAFCLEHLVNMEGRSLAFRRFSPALTGEMYLVSKRFQTFNKAAALFKEKLLRNESVSIFMNKPVQSKKARAKQ